MGGMAMLATKYNTTVPDLLSFMMNESGLDPAAHNKNGNASGLIQIMPSTLKGMKERKYESVKDIETVDDIRKLSIEKQVPIIDDYFDYTGLKKSGEVAKKEGRNVDMATLYSAVFLPAFKDKPNNFIMGIRPGETIDGKKSTDFLYGKTTYGRVYLDNNAFDIGSKITEWIDADGNTYKNPKDAQGKKVKPNKAEGGKGYYNKGDVGIKAGKFNNLVGAALDSDRQAKLQSLANTPSANESGQKLDEESIKNAQAREAAKIGSPQNTQNNIQVNQPSGLQQGRKDKPDDRNPQQKKADQR